jgi:hypothetical protein
MKLFGNSCLYEDRYTGYFKALKGAREPFEVAFVNCSPRSPSGIIELVRQLADAKINTLVLAGHYGMSCASLLWTADQFESELIALDEEEDAACMIILKITDAVTILNAANSPPAVFTQELLEACGYYA